jgi:hypothetical protein
MRAWFRHWEAARACLVERSPARVAREVISPTFRGSRRELELATAVRLQAAVVLIFLAARCVHLGQAMVDLGLAGGVYAHEGLAIGLGAACWLESVAFAALVLGARRLSRGALLGDAVFGVVGLAVMSMATDPTPGRADSLNWMLPYTVATATGLGTVMLGDLVDRGRRIGRGARLWPLAMALGLAGAYIASAYLPNRLRGDRPDQIWGNAANYVVFFAAGVLTLAVTRRLVAALAARNADVTRTAAELAREAQWRAVTVDVFGPVVDLLDRVAQLRDGSMPAPVMREACRLIAMIDAVRPGDVGSRADGEDRQLEG